MRVCSTVQQQVCQFIQVTVAADMKSCPAHGQDQLPFLSLSLYINIDTQSNPPSLPFDGPPERIPGIHIAPRLNQRCAQTHVATVQANLRHATTHDTSALLGSALLSSSYQNERGLMESISAVHILLLGFEQQLGDGVLDPIAMALECNTVQ